MTSDLSSFLDHSYVLVAGTDRAGLNTMPIPTSLPPGKRTHSQTPRIAVSEAPAWLRSLASELKDRRDVVLVVADEPLRQRLVEALRLMAREVLAASQLLDAMQIVQSRGDRRVVLIA